MANRSWSLFNGYYDTHCFLPLLLHVTAEDGHQRLVSALLRPAPP